MERAHPGVDLYIGRLPAWQQDICRELREIIWAADPAIEETIKRSVQPYYVLEGNVCALLAAKDHVNLFLYDPTTPDPHGLINQGHGNATARAIQIYDGDAIHRAALTEMVRAIVANNRAGGWRKLGASRAGRTPNWRSLAALPVRRGAGWPWCPRPVSSGAPRVRWSS